MKHFKSLSCLCMIMGLLVILTGCPNPANMAEIENPEPEPKGMAYFTYFDTVSSVYSYSGDSQEQFEKNCEEITAILGEYHKLFDIYHEYSGIINLCTVNKNAGGDWLQVDGKLIDFLLYAEELNTVTNGEMNIMMGAVLRPWHDCRTAATNGQENAIPSPELLSEAGKHISFASLEIDEARNAVRITDPDASIDVGALGKGYATEMAAKHLEEKGIEHYVLNIGGNIRIIGTKPNGEGWLTGIKNPDNPETYASYITISDTSCVTSGNYERYYVVDGERYHHIIDKDTLMPAAHFASVSVITKNSGLADALSTALYCMSYEEGVALLENFEGVEVLWITEDGTQYMTDGFSVLITERDGQ